MSSLPPSSQPLPGADSTPESQLAAGSAPETPPPGDSVSDDAAAAAHGEADVELDAASSALAQDLERIAK